MINRELLSALPNLLKKRFRRAMGSTRGFTLIETLVSVSILIVVTGIFGAAMFQVFGLQRYWTDDIKATRTTRHAASWFAGDALNTTNVLNAATDPIVALECGIDPVDAVTLQWTNSGGEIVSVTYSLTDDLLLRDQEVGGTPVGGSLRMTEGVKENTLEFTLSCGDSILRTKMDVASDRDNVESLDLITFLRKLDAG